MCPQSLRTRVRWRVWGPVDEAEPPEPPAPPVRFLLPAGRGDAWSRGSRPWSRPPKQTSSTCTTWLVKGPWHRRLSNRGSGWAAGGSASAPARAELLEPPGCAQALPWARVTMLHDIMLAVDGEGAPG